MIDNFILVHYRRDAFDNMPEYEKKANGNIDMVAWADIHFRLLRQQIAQIRSMYPRAKIHLITSELNVPSNVICHWSPASPKNHICKLAIYDLLDEPAMYIDSDILLLRPFEEQHLTTTNSFNTYRSHSTYDFRKVASKELPFHIPCQPNAGMVWIPKPSKALAQELYEIHSDYFNDKQRFLDNNYWADNDELALAFYIQKHQIKMNEFRDVSVPRSWPNLGDIRQYHSIHYTGIETSWKKLCLVEYTEYKRKMHL